MKKIRKSQEKAAPPHLRTARFAPRRGCAPSLTGIGSVMTGDRADPRRGTETVCLFRSVRTYFGHKAAAEGFFVFISDIETSAQAKYLHEGRTTYYFWTNKILRV